MRRKLTAHPSHAKMFFVLRQTFSDYKNFSSTARVKRIAPLRRERVTKMNV